MCIHVNALVQDRLALLMNQTETSDQDVLVPVATVRMAAELK